LDGIQITAFWKSLLKVPLDDFVRLTKWHLLYLLVVKTEGAYARRLSSDDQADILLSRAVSTLTPAERFPYCPRDVSALLEDGNEDEQLDARKQLFFVPE
jgi:hypothetical protein